MKLLLVLSLVGLGLAPAPTESVGQEPDGARPGAEEWAAVWRDARQLKLLPTDSEEAAALAGRLASVVERNPGSARAELLAAWCALRAGRAHSLSVPADWPWTGIENWLAAEILFPGPARTRALVLALGELEVEPNAGELQLAWETGVSYATERLWLEQAGEIQHALHERYQSTWSAMGLAYTLHRAGQWEQADAVLAAQLELDMDLAELWSNRGLLALGAGHERLGRDALGRAVGMGSGDAGMILARADLAGGEVALARGGFRCLLLDLEPHAWALRGWGVALLPTPEPRPTSMNSE